MLMAAVMLVACDDRTSPGSAATATNDSRQGAAAEQLPRATQQALDDARSAVEQYLLEGRPREALLITSKLVEASPRGAIDLELHARALLADAMLGATESRQDAMNRAADAYVAAASLDASNAQLQHAAGVALDQALRVNDALVLYRRATTLDPSNPQYALYTAMALRRTGETTEALRLLDMAQRQAPGEPLIEVIRSDALLANGDATGSLQAAQRARELAPQNLEARIAEARALRAVDQSTEAAEALSALPRETRSKEAVAQELALALLAIGRPQDAARAWEDSMESDPLRWRSAVGAAEAWLAAGDTIRAYARLEHARSLAPKEPRVIEVQAKLDAARGAGVRPAP